MESCGRSVVKYLLFIFNLIFAVSGIGIVVAGAVVLAEIGEHTRFLDEMILAPPIVLIAAGAIVFIIAFLGCYGAIRESTKLLTAFAVLLLIIFFLELAVGITAAVFKSDFEDTLKDTLLKSLKGYPDSETERFAWDNAHTKLQCCGVEDPQDWQKELRIDRPLSCCHTIDEMNEAQDAYCIRNARGKYSFQIGCYERLKMKLHMSSDILIGVGIGIAFVEIIGVVLACWLISTIKKEQDPEEDAEK